MKIIRRLSMIFSFLAILFSFLARWLLNTWGNISMEGIVFHLKVPLTGTSNEYIYGFILNVLIPTFILYIIIYIFILLVLKNYLIFEIIIKKINKKIYFNLFGIHSKIYYQVVFLLSIFIINISIGYVIGKLDIKEYLKNQMTNSPFIEENYINPDDVNLIFPKNKQNLIYIFLESMESSYTDIENGGIMEENLIPNLTKLYKKNISFSNNEKLGGALNMTGSTWTIGAMVAQTSGVPLKLPIDGNSYGKNQAFLKGITTLGNILKENGYNQYIIMGSDSNFAGRKGYFEQHGNYEIFDVYTAIKEEKMNEFDRVWWGFEDVDLYEWSKEKLLMLSSKEEPFNFTLLTADTHAEDGWLSDSCEVKYDDQYSNVISCADKQISDFINWIKKQDFYKNTTIVIVGDHLTMDFDFFEGKDVNFQRTIYNTFINSKVTTENNVNRLFSSYDLFPTTLASMGVKIEGNKLGLGVNLFSDEKTIIEKYGYSYVLNELNKKSNFYNDNFLYVK